MLSAAPHCTKGMCMTPATRSASYTFEGRIAGVGPSCDSHGGEPVLEYPNAEELRRAAHALTAAGRTPWWVDYSGPLNPPAD